MGALSRLLRAMLLRTPDMDAFQHSQNHPPLSNPTFAQHAEEWQTTHQTEDSPLLSGRFRPRSGPPHGPHAIA